MARTVEEVLALLAARRAALEDQATAERERLDVDRRESEAPDQLAEARALAERAATSRADTSAATERVNYLRARLAARRGGG